MKNDWQDNCLVGEDADCRYYFGIVIKQPSQDSPWSARLHRYAVSGRIDIYSFTLDLNAVARVGFTTEAATAIADALRQFHRDLNKRSVVALLEKCVDECRCLRILHPFLDITAPKTKSFAALDVIAGKRRAHMATQLTKIK